MFGNTAETSAIT